MAYDLVELGERRRLFGAMVLAVLLASSLVAFLLASRLRGTIATPPTQLAEAATSVSQTKDYSVRARKLSGDELGLRYHARRHSGRRRTRATPSKLHLPASEMQSYRPTSRAVFPSPIALRSRS